MTAPPETLPTGQPVLGPDLGRRLQVLAEVVLAFALVHVSYRAFKHFTPLGQMEGAARLNYSAGACMILFTIGAAWVDGRRFGEYGLTLNNWRVNLNVGLIWGVLPVVLAGLIIKAAQLHVEPDRGVPLNLLPAYAIGNSVLALLMLLMLRPDRPWLHVSPDVTLPLILVLLSLPALAALYLHRPAAHVIAATGWSFFGAGFGEEIFFRGFVQSRVNQAFGRPLRLFGMRFGMGLLVSSLLFGLIHALNTVDYFTGRWTFAWSWGAAEVFAGIFLGAMRERTGSILPGAIVHGLGDVLPLIVSIK